MESNMLWSLLLFLALQSLAVAKKESHKLSHEAEQLRSRWTASEVIHDLNHIKDDMSKLYDLQRSGEIEAKDATFYFFRMHDFDDNNLLDGLEIRVALIHSLEHQKLGQAVRLDDIPMLVDTTLELDRDNDGFLSYAEARVAEE
ncbi:multiple coagulation factor deficiency protein 2 homolog [Ornithodoros turicata]|uniref:multiple coagulation factor deficiency protein 2 homolog n=1 Tax=Ornithodoros turicata TaxID=34597 RepID=UPI0031393058